MHSEEARILFTVLVACCVLAVLVAFFVVTIVRHQQRKMALEREKLVTEILLLENERGRIAADLHDELGSLISAIKLNLQCMDHIAEEDVQILERTNGYIDTTMQKIREISNNLMPKSLQKKGLFAAVQQFTEMISHTGAITVKYSFPKNGIGINEEQDIHVYRIVQEITNNAIKHAKASIINISFTEPKKNTLQLDMKDNGVGFDIAAAGNQPGHGLQNIMRRVDMMQGRIYLDSAPGKGTHYSIEIFL